jgi:glycerol kinase
MQQGVWPDQGGFASAWRLQQRFAPGMDAAARDGLLDGWRDAVSRTLSS